MEPLDARPSILIADDDDGWRLTLRDLFEPRGYHTILAADGREAISLAERADAMLLDVHMPELDGLETLKIVRRSKPIVPCVIMTGDPSEAILRQAMRLNAFAVLTKPFGRQTITTVLRDALSDR